MRDFKEELQDMMERMIRLQDQYEKELTEYPDGTMWRTTVNERNYYYRAVRKGDRYVRESISGDTQMQGMMARKAFLKSSLRLLGENITTMSRMLKRFHSLEEGAVIPTLTSAYRDLPAAAFRKPRKERPKRFGGHPDGDRAARLEGALSGPGPMDLPEAWAIDDVPPADGSWDEIALYGPEDPWMSVTDIQEGSWAEPWEEPWEETA